MTAISRNFDPTTCQVIIEWAGIFLLWATYFIKKIFTNTTTNIIKCIRIFKLGCQSIPTNRSWFFLIHFSCKSLQNLNNNFSPKFHIPSHNSGKTSTPVDNPLTLIMISRRIKPCWKVSCTTKGPFFYDHLSRRDNRVNWHNSSIGNYSTIVTIAGSCAKYLYWATIK